MAPSMKIETLRIPEALGNKKGKNRPGHQDKRQVSFVESNTLDFGDTARKQALRPS